VIRRPWIHPLVVLVLAVVAALGCILLPGGPWVRMPFVLALAFVIPGYAVMSALFPDPGRDRIRVFLLSFGVSLAISVVVAVELGGARHLNTTAWTGTLVGVTLCAAIVMWRRGSIAPTAPRRPARVGRRLILPGVLVAATIAILGGSIALARTPLPVPDDRGYTVLTIGPVVGEPGVVSVEARSEEATTRRFLMVVEGPGIGRTGRYYTVKPGGTVRFHASVPLTAGGTVEARLFDMAHPRRIYRRVSMTVPALGPAPVVQGAGG
jgi:Protein of unknown function (DUF1616)